MRPILPVDPKSSIFMNDKQSKKLENKKQLLKRSSNMCVYCSCDLTLDTMTIDHIIPKSGGGPNMLYNMAACCYKCNNLKSNMDHKLFIELMAEDDGINKIQEIIKSKNAIDNLPDILAMKCNTIISMIRHIKNGCIDDSIYRDLSDNAESVNNIVTEIINNRFKSIQ